MLRPSVALDFLAALLAPRDCAACGCPTEAGFCRPCRRQIAPAPAVSLWGRPVLAGGLYAAPLDRAITRFKFEGRPDLAPALVEVLLPVLRPIVVGKPVLFVPVPLHPTRLAERGYDQACLLASRLAARTRTRWRPRSLERVVRTEQQARLDREERQRNVEAAFAARDPRLTGECVVLVDDVVTSGATAQACACALEAAGATVAAVACVARTA